MNAIHPRRDIMRERLVNAGALIILLAIGALALVGPSGLLAWGEDSARLTQYEGRIAQLRAREAELQNRKALLAPGNVDPDLASELLRRDLNVAHPDEYVMELEEQP